MQASHRRIGGLILAAAFGAAALCTGPAHAVSFSKEDQSHIIDQNKQEVSRSALVRLLHNEPGGGFVLRLSEMGRGQLWVSKVS